MPTADAYDESSWGATLQGYANSRTQIPWEQADLRPAKQNERNNQNHPASKVFNPVLMKFNDSRKESKHAAAEDEFNVHRLNVAKDRQLFYEQKYNIVSHKSYLKPTGQTARERPPIPDSRVPYNLVSHYSKEAHRTQSIGMVPPEITARPIEGQDESLRVDPGKRPYDILSNKYVEDHSRKERQDEAAARSEAEEKYWQTHDYDAVQGKYLAGEKEAEYQRQRAALEHVHGAGQLARLPPSVQYSEGAGFNIITQDVKDRLKVEATEGAGQRRFNNKKGAMIEAQCRQRSEMKQDLEEERAMGRIGRTGVAKAREDGRHHGYDVLTNEQHHGRSGKHLAPSRLRPPEPVLSKLMGDTMSGHDRGPMGTSVASFALSTAMPHMGGTGCGASNGGGGSSGRPRDLSGFGPAAAARTMLGETGGFGGGGGGGGGYQSQQPQQPAATLGRQSQSARSSSAALVSSARPSARSTARGTSSARARVGGGLTNSSARAGPPSVPAVSMAGVFDFKRPP
jgi:hypothetical protein